ncbi:MAG: cysteine desulfurase family protein, partial [Patescibacteria group bacterium]
MSFLDFKKDQKIDEKKNSVTDKRVYLDYAATTPTDPSVFEVMRPYFIEEGGNASSIHQFGQAAAKAVVEARQRVADFLNCEPREVIFNSGATEGNNTIIKGFGRSRKIAAKLGAKPHLIVSEIEHECVFAAAKFLQEIGEAEVTFAPVNREGIVELTEIQKAVKPNTVLISLMYANNEIGTIQPVAEVGAWLKEINATRSAKIYFHTDAVQAANYLPCDAQKLGVDFLTLSGHKFYGPKGAGVLFIRSGAGVFDKFMHGGEQEFHWRAGTHNTPGIVGLGAAIARLKNNQAEVKEIKRLREKLID